MEVTAGVPPEMTLMLHAFLEDKTLPYGALDRLAADGFTLPVADLPKLLDRYRWKKNERRDHVQALLSVTLTAMAEFRNACDATLEESNGRTPTGKSSGHVATGKSSGHVATSKSLSLVAVEGGLQRAHERLTDAVRRAVRAHVVKASRWVPASIEGHVVSNVETSSEQCSPRRSMPASSLRCDLTPFSHLPSPSLPFPPLPSPSHR